MPAPYRTLNPATEELLGEFPLATAGEVEAALTQSEGAFRRWRGVSPGERGRLLLALATLLESRAEEFAALMAVEMGKPAAEGVAEARKCALVCRHYAEHGEEFLRPTPLPSDAGEAFVRHDPLGPILAIMPWNFPFWQVFRFGAPSLMAGNTVVLKHAPNTPRCANAIAALFGEAGFPPGVFTSLFLDNEQAAAVIADGRIRGVTLTGSTAAGRKVASRGGGALKPMVMELGGSDPFLVLPDADLEAAAETAVASRCLNSGQSCICAKRFLVAKEVYTEFAERLVEGMRARVVGDPLTRGVNIGPLARADLRENLAGQVRKTIDAGAKLIDAGSIPEGPGYYHAPAILVDIPEGSPAWKDELFGPVASLFRFASDKEAIRLANGTEYGLGAAVWTADRERAMAFAERLDAGCVFVNGMVKSDPRLPFGGIKSSGFGRELGREGMLEFVNRKTVWSAPARAGDGRGEE